MSRCALLNAPAGTFSKDIDRVESVRAIVARQPVRSPDRAGFAGCTTE